MSAYSNSSDTFSNRGRRYRAPWHPVELIAMFLGFILFWPLGLAILLLKIWQRKIGETGDLTSVARAAWARGEDYATSMSRGWTSQRPVWTQPGTGQGFGRTGNSAFDDWRTSEMAKLEQERQRLAQAEREFADHIEGLRRSRDREEFERFMAARKNASNTDGGKGA